jgi:hypothetical protein
MSLICPEERLRPGFEALTARFRHCGLLAVGGSSSRRRRGLEQRKSRILTVGESSGTFPPDRRGYHRGRTAPQSDEPRRAFWPGLAISLDHASRPPVSRRPNYGYARRQKALDRQARQQAKRPRKTTRAESGAEGLGMGEAQDVRAPPGTWEWFSPSRSRPLAAPGGSRPNAGVRTTGFFCRRRGPTRTRRASTAIATRPADQDGKRRGLRQRDRARSQRLRRRRC